MLFICIQFCLLGSKQHSELGEKVLIQLLLPHFRAPKQWESLSQSPSPSPQRFEEVQQSLEGSVPLHPLKFGSMTEKIEKLVNGGKFQSS